MFSYLHCVRTVTYSLFQRKNPYNIQFMKSLTITAPDDWHLHLRDNEALNRTVPDATHQFQRAIIMPNLIPPITNVSLALAYQERIKAHIPAGRSFTPLMTLYLTNDTTAETVAAAAASDSIYAFKLYPAGATTNSEAGVNRVEHLYPVFEAMQSHNVPLLIHGEITHGDIFDREQQFIETILTPLRAEFPNLRIVLEHITTAAAVDFVLQANDNTAATITVHHLLFERNQLLAGGIKPDYYCLPILKRAEDQQALSAAATSGNKKFFLGTDSAPHSTESKYSACGCAGIYSAHCAIELYAHVFEQAGALDKLEGFASFYGPDFYGLQRNQNQITLLKQVQTIPEVLSFGEQQVTPLWAGQDLKWSLADD